MTNLQHIFETIGGVLWGPFVLIPLLLGTGLYLTIRLGGLQFRMLGPALRLAFVKRADKEPGSSEIEGDISHYQALTTALAATVGVGNIAGVATAIHIGGPGAVFWMWVTGLVGMASKYAEAFMGVRYRTKDANGEISGGPQYYLEKTTKGSFGKVLAISFAIFAVLASFGIGNMTQSNAVSGQMQASFGFDPVLIGLIMAVGVGMVLLGGIKSIGKVTSAFVPMMIVLYVGGSLIVLALNWKGIPGAFATIFHDAFTGTAATGGFVGSVFLVALRYGVARGIFSNESGMGSAAIAAAAAKTRHPVRQGLVSMTQTFIDTLIVVTMTALVIVVTGAWKTGLDGAPLTAEAFNIGFPGTQGHFIVAISVVFFAFSTVLGWAYYGERSIERLVGIRGVKPYRLLFTIVVFIGAITELKVVWAFSDMMNALMAIPNLIGLLLASGLIVRETKAYLERDPDLTNPFDPDVEVPIEDGKA